FFRARWLIGARRRGGLLGAGCICTAPVRHGQSHGAGTHQHESSHGTDGDELPPSGGPPRPFGTLQPLLVTPPRALTLAFTGGHPFSFSIDAPAGRSGHGAAGRGELPPRYPCRPSYKAAPAHVSPGPPDWITG